MTIKKMLSKGLTVVYFYILPEFIRAVHAEKF